MLFVGSREVLVAQALKDFGDVIDHKAISIGEQIVSDRSHLPAGAEGVQTVKKRRVDVLVR